MRNVLIFHLGALGDFVLTWPLAIALLRVHPQSRIVYVTHAQKGALAEKLVGVESADIEGGWHHLFGDPTGLPAPAAKLLRDAHSVYSFIAAKDDAWVGNVRKIATQADVCCLLPRPTGNVAQHAAEFIAAQLDSRPAVAEAVRSVLRRLSERGLKTPRPDTKTIVIHPGSGSKEKCWPAERFLELARRLIASGQDVNFILGEVEFDAGRVNSCASLNRRR